MSKQWAYICLEKGQTVKSFRESLTHLPDDAVIPWEAIVDYSELIPEEGRGTTLRLPLVVER